MIKFQKLMEKPSSVYGELRWDINDTMQLTAGGRYIDE